MNDHGTAKHNRESTAIPEGWELVTRRDKEFGTVLIFTSTRRPEGRLNKIVVLGQTYEDALAEAQRRMQLYDDVQTHHNRNRRQRTGWNA